MEPFEVNQLMNAVFFRETFDKPVLMLLNTTIQIIGHTNIQCPVGLAGENINEKILHHRDFTR